MSDKIFVDTSVLVSCRDASDPSRQKQSMAWMVHLWKEKTGRLSFQVLNEFYMTVTHKLQPGMDPHSAREDVRSLLAWHPIPMDARVVEGAWRVQNRYKLSWWDALIVSAARVGECRYLLTDTLTENQSMGTLKVINPFHTLPEALG